MAVVCGWAARRWCLDRDAFSTTTKGPNVKLSFDGVRWITQTSHLRWDVFALKPVEDNSTGFFEDHPNAQQTTWAAISQFWRRYSREAWSISTTWGLRRRRVVQSRLCDRASPYRGYKSLPPSNGLDYNWEANFQWGSFRSDSGDGIHARSRSISSSPNVAARCVQR